MGHAAHTTNVFCCFTLFVVVDVFFDHVSLHQNHILFLRFFTSMVHINGSPAQTHISVCIVQQSEYNIHVRNITN